MPLTRSFVLAPVRRVGLSPSGSRTFRGLGLALNEPGARRHHGYRVRSRASSVLWPGGVGVPHYDPTTCRGGCRWIGSVPDVAALVASTDEQVNVLLAVATGGP